MTRITQYRNGFEAPSSTDPANFADEMNRVATQVDTVFTDLSLWARHLQYQGAGELGLTAVVRSNSAQIPNFNAGFEKAVMWDSSLFDNTGVSPNGEFVLPDQDQRYWWWMGANVLMQGGSANCRYTSRMYVQDRDPASGALSTSVYRYNAYMSGTGEQFMIFDTFLRTGGGRVRLTVSHNSSSTPLYMAAGSILWAIRMNPDR